MKLWQIEYTQVVNETYLFEVEAEDVSDALAIGADTFFNSGTILKPSFKYPETMSIEAKEIIEEKTEETNSI